MTDRILAPLLLVCGAALSFASCGSEAPPEAILVFREDFRSLPAHIPVGEEDLTCAFLGLDRIGSSADQYKLSFHPKVENDPHYVWNGECKHAAMLAFPFAHPLDCSAADTVVRLRTKIVGASRLHLALQIRDLRDESYWIVQDRGIEEDIDWTVHTLRVPGETWRRLDRRTLDFGPRVERPWWKKVEAIGFVSPLVPQRSKDCTRLDHFELVSSSARIRDGAKRVRRAPKARFVEPATRVFRSALVVPGKRADRTRRGVLVRAGAGTWACFDPDLLRWSAVWRPPYKQPPITLDSMAAASYPAGARKSKRAPRPSAPVLLRSRELPGIGAGREPAPDPRSSVLLEGGKGRVGPMPAEIARWSGVTQHGDASVLRYMLASCRVRERVFAPDAETFHRVVELAPSEKPITLRLEARRAAITDDVARFEKGSFQSLRVEGGGAALRSSKRHGTYAVFEPSTDTRVVRFAWSSRDVPAVASAPNLVEAPVGAPVLDAAFGVSSLRVTSAPHLASKDAISQRVFRLPKRDRGDRAIRPTDLAFYKNGDALLTTLDGDVWRVRGLESRHATWARVATGLFEPMGIEIDREDRVFVLGRDQITRLLDEDGDGNFDVFDNVSDAFLQTLHTRDYATSLVLEPEGSFLVAKGGIMSIGKTEVERTKHRGTVLRIASDGRATDVLATGLRLPFVGRRADGAIFASDQQGPFVPSSPVHRIEKGVPHLGFEPTRQSEKSTTEPLLWYPHQANRSGAGFVTLSARAFPSLGEHRFAHVSWTGRLFPIVTPDEGLAFSYRLPLQFDFPSLNAATHPTTGELFVIGLGISGYQPTTEKLTGIAAIRENAERGEATFVAPVRLDIAKTRVRVAFGRALHPEQSVTVASLRLWNLQRTKRYGSPHYLWDGSTGEHVISPVSVTLGAARDELVIEVPALFRSDIFVLRLGVHDAGGRVHSYPLELYARAKHLDAPTTAELEEIARRRAAPRKLSPGDAGAGRAIFKRFACTTCHAVDAGIKLNGPSLAGVTKRAPGDVDAHLRSSILEPNKVVTEGYEPNMPSYAGVIPAQELEHLLAYLKSL